MLAVLKPAVRWYDGDQHNQVQGYRVRSRRYRFWGCTCSCGPLERMEDAATDRSVLSVMCSTCAHDDLRTSPSVIECTRQPREIADGPLRRSGHGGRRQHVSLDGQRLRYSATA
jgi:hypothetical protein